MSGRKRLSGHEYKLLRIDKKKKREEVLNQTPKLNTFFKEAISEPETSTSQIYEVESNATNTPSVQPTVSDSVLTDNIFEISSDPSDWAINKSTLDYIASHGFTQNVRLLDFSKSKHIYPDQSRYCPVSIFKRKLWNDEVVTREWIAYSEKTGRLFCIPCLLFKNGDSQFGSCGYWDWKNVFKRTEEHENSKLHKTCVYNFLCLQNQPGRIDYQIVRQLQEEISYWRNVLKRVVAIVKSLSSRGLAFRGEDERFGVSNNGNFIMCLELLAQFDPFLAEHIARFGQKGSGTTNYLSKTIYEEFIVLMAKKVSNSITEELKKCKYFSMIVDSTPDIAHNDQLALIIRYVQQDGVPIERFLKFLPNVGHKAQDMFDCLTNTFKSLGIDISNCRGQSYDNAANMSGIYNGLQAKIKELCPQAYYIPCSAHSLNLVGSSAAECCMEATAYFDLLQGLYNFFGASTARWNVLQTFCSEKVDCHLPTLKSLSSTRWSARDDASKTLRVASAEIHKALCFFETDASQKPIIRNEAIGLRKKLERFETTFMIVFWGFLLDRINIVNKSLQSVDINILQAIELYHSLIGVIQSLREQFDYYENEAKKIYFLDEFTYENDTKRRKIRSLKSDETRDSRKTDVILNGRDNFRISTFNIIIDTLLHQLEKRISCYKELSKTFGFLDAAFLKTMKGNFDNDEIKKTAQLLRDNYPHDINGNLEDELSHFTQHCSFTENEVGNNMTVFFKWFTKMNLKHIYPNIDIIFRLCLSLPVSNCSAERSFSVLKRVLNYLRSTTKQERLESMAILNIESDLTMSLDYDHIINDFAEQKARKKSLSLV